MVSKIAKKSEITSAAIFRCTARCTFTEKGTTIQAGQSFYRVNSDTVNDSYIVAWDKQTQRMECNCPCGQEHHHTLECKHIRAAWSNIQARKELSKQQVPTPVAPLASYDVVGESLKVVNQAIADIKIGDHYEVVGAMYQQQQVAREAEIAPICDGCCKIFKPVYAGQTTCYRCC